MHFFLIDYSSGHYGNAAPSVQGGKFIQVRNHDTEYLILSLKELTPYHANIAERFFSEKRVAGSLNGKKTFFTLQDAGWEILGGGSWELDARAGTLRLYGASQAYGRCDRRGLAQRISGVQDFSSYTISVE